MRVECKGLCIAVRLSRAEETRVRTFVVAAKTKRSTLFGQLNWLYQPTRQLLLALICPLHNYAALNLIESKLRTNTRIHTHTLMVQHFLARAHINALTPTRVGLPHTCEKLKLINVGAHVRKTSRKKTKKSATKTKEIRYARSSEYKR